MAYSPQALANAIQPTAAAAPVGTATPLSAPAPTMMQAPQVTNSPFQSHLGAPISHPVPFWAPQGAQAAGPTPASPLPGPPMSMGGWPSSAPQMGQPQGGGNPGFSWLHGLGGGGGGFPGFGQAQDGMAHTLSQIGLPLHRSSPRGF